MDGWMDGCMHACMHGWMDGWMDGYRYRPIYIYIDRHIHTLSHPTIISSHLLLSACIPC